MQSTHCTRVALFWQGEAREGGGPLSTFASNRKITYEDKLSSGPCRVGFREACTIKHGFFLGCAFEEEHLFTELHCQGAGLQPSRSRVSLTDITSDPCATCACAQQSQAS